MTSDVFQSTDVRHDVTSEIALDPVCPLNQIANFRRFVFREIFRAGVKVYANVPQHVAACTPADPIEVGERNFNALVVGDHDARNTYRHRLIPAAAYVSDSHCRRHRSSPAGGQWYSGHSELSQMPELS